MKIPDELQPFAFPCVDPISAEVYSEGMTLRDYFAAKAMQGFISQQSASYGHWELEAVAAYEIADAMLQARAR